MNGKIDEYDERIHCSPERGGAYVIYPWNNREEYGKGRVYIHAELTGEPYEGRIAHRGVKHADAEV